jgi:hypothetical protein
MEWMSCGSCWQLASWCVGWLAVHATAWCCVDLSWCFSVNLTLVAAEGIDVSEFFQTDSTFVRLFASVDSHVDCK